MHQVTDGCPVILIHLNTGWTGFTVCGLSLAAGAVSLIPSVLSDQINLDVASYLTPLKKTKLFFLSCQHVPFLYARRHIMREIISQH